jgi:FixJ family two-component response regulator
MTDQPVAYLVDDDPGMLRALSRLLHAEGVEAQAFGSAEEFLQTHDPRQPGCAVLDLRLPGLDGLALQQALLAADSERYVVFMTAYADVASSVQAMKAGALDFLVKPFDDQVFMGAVRNAIARDLQSRRIRSKLQAVRWRLATLTRREHQVLQHVVVGRLNKQIAADLGITEKTIKVHRARAMEKMGAATLAELVRKADELEAGTILDGTAGDEPGLA